MPSFLPNVLSPGFWKGLWRDVRLVWKVAMDPRVSTSQKAILIAVAAYLISPFDLIPGFLPIIGQMDDLAILMLGLKLFLRVVPDEIVAEHRQSLG